MAANTEITLTRKKSGDSDKTFLFRCVGNFKSKKSQQVISVPLINTAPDNNALFRFFGQDEDISFSFVLFDDGTDVSNGTGTDINTINEQILWLRDNVFTHEISTYWELSVNANGGRFYPTAIDCVITDLDIDNDAGRVSAITGTISLKRGTLGALS